MSVFLFKENILREVISFKLSILKIYVTLLVFNWMKPLGIFRKEIKIMILSIIVAVSLLKINLVPFCYLRK